MSKTTKDLLFQVRKFIPPLLEKFHKGQMGRVAVIGGCEDYTGAPFFSAHASALMGADMSHVICEPGAATVIKTYSPNIMVHPYMRQKQHAEEGMQTADEVSKQVLDMLDRLHVIVVGPGLGRDELMQSTAGKVIRAAREKGMGIVIDADALMLVSGDPSIVTGYKNAILTPNVMEFGRLCKALKVDTEEDPKTACARLAKALGGLTVIQKGAVDYISNGEQTMVSDIQGGLKRSGGQGDTLTGALATFLAWKKAYQDKIWDHDGSLTDTQLTALAAFGASSLTRTCSKLAFEKLGRHMQASDLQPNLQSAFTQLFEGEGPKL